MKMRKSIWDLLGVVISDIWVEILNEDRGQVLKRKVETKHNDLEVITFVVFEAGESVQCEIQKHWS